MVQKFRPALPGLSRRQVLQMSAASAAALSVSSLGFPAIAEDKPEQLVIGSGGGALDEAYKKAYWDTFTAKTGIKIITTEYVGVAQIQAMQEANNVTVDLINIDGAEAPVAGQKGWLVPIDWSLSDRAKVLPIAAQDDHVLAEVAAKVMAWNTDTFPADKAPKDWTSMWDMAAYPGKRSLWKQAFQTLEVALMGDGVPLDKIYPMDVDKALAALDKIRPELIWWDSGAQSAQLLVDGETAIGSSWSGRVAKPKSEGAKIDFTFNQALLVAGAWAIIKGTKNEKWSQEFIAHTLLPENQKVYCETIAYGPVVPEVLGMLPPERVAELPDPNKGLFSDYKYWATNGDAVIAKFNDWLTKG